MLVALIPTAFWLVFMVLRRRGAEVRAALLEAMTLLGAYTVLVTEVLSVPHWLARGPLAAAWALLGVAAIVLLRFDRARPAPLPMPAMGRVERWFLGAGALLVAIVAVDVAFSAPNTWDSMMYHLPRVVRWLDERSVSFYPTVDYQQLTMSPWHEYAMLQAHALWGGDRFDPMVSLLCWVGSALAASGIAANIGAGPRGQALAGFVCLTMPQGILMASSSKNDWAGAFWLTVAAYAFLRWTSETTRPYACALVGGTALGLAIFTKGTAYVYFPWIFLATAAQWNRAAWRRFLVWAPLAGVLALAPSIPLLARNQQLSGHVLGYASPLGDGDAAGKTNFSVAHVTVRGTAAGVIRNVALHVSTPSTAVNRLFYRVAVGAIHAIGADPDDPDAMMQGKATHINYTFTVNPLLRHEIFAGSPLHLLLFVAAMVWLAGLTGRPRNVPALWLCGGLVVGFIAISGYLRYEPFNARLHLPLLAIGCPPIGVFLEQLPSKLGDGCVALLFLFGLPDALSNNLRPLVPGRARPSEAYPHESIFQRPREASYFADNHDRLVPSWTAAARAVNATACRDVGIETSGLYTYPMFALLDAGVERQVRYLGVKNRTAAYAHPNDPPPCAIVCLDCAEEGPAYADHPEVGPATRFGDIVTWMPPMSGP